MKSYLPHPFQVKAALEGRLKVLIQLVKPQPPFGCAYVMNGARDHALCFVPETTDNGKWTSETILVPPTPRSKDHRLPVPYPPDSLIYFREAWTALDTAHKMVDDDSEEGYHSEFLVAVKYKSGGDLWLPVSEARYDAVNEWIDNMEQEGTNYRSAMPAELARIYLKPEESYPKRVQEVTEEEAEWYGIEVVGFDADTCDPMWKNYMKDLGKRPPFYHSSINSFRTAFELRHPGAFEQNCWIWLTPVSVISTNGKPAEL